MTENRMQKTECRRQKTRDRIVEFFYFNRPLGKLEVTGGLRLGWQGGAWGDELGWRVEQLSSRE
jgi:hypothetical protein